jgi:hypothetical protein
MVITTITKEGEGGAMNLNDDQLRQLDRVAAKGRRLSEAKREVEKAKRELQRAVDDAVDAHVPMRQIAPAAGVDRSLILYWRDRQREVA